MEKSINKISKTRQESSGTADIARVLKVGFGLTKNFRSADTKQPLDLSAPLVGTKRVQSEVQQNDNTEDIEIGLTKEEEKRLEGYEEFRALREKFPKKKGRQRTEFYRLAGILKRKYPQKMTEEPTDQGLNHEVKEVEEEKEHQVRDKTPERCQDMVDAVAQTEEATGEEDARGAFDRACKDFDDEELRIEMLKNKLDTSQIKHLVECQRLKELLSNLIEGFFDAQPE